MEMNDPLGLTAAPPRTRSFPPARPSAEPRRGRHAPSSLLHAGRGSAPSLADPASGRGRGGCRGPAEQGRGWPAFSHAQAEPATRGKRPPDPEAWVGPQPGGMTVRFGHRRLGVPDARVPQPPRRPNAPGPAPLPAGPSRPIRGRSGPGPPRPQSPPRTPSARPAAPPPSSLCAPPEALRPPPHSLSPAAAFRLPVDPAQPCGARPQAPPHAVPHAKSSVRETPRLRALWRPRRGLAAQGRGWKPGGG